jgi:hypothetical protein
LADFLDDTRPDKRRLWIDEYAPLRDPGFQRTSLALVEFLVDELTPAQSVESVEQVLAVGGTPRYVGS